MNRLLEYLGKLPTTQLRIAVTLLLTVFTAARYLIGGVPTVVAASGAVTTDGWGYWLLFLAGMSGLDVAQYVGKRFSDSGYAAAKNAAPPPPPVTVTTTSGPTSTSSTVSTEPSPEG
jgi:hypothetical protein